MTASRLIARLLTGVYALLAIPASMLLLGYAISRWLQITREGAPASEILRQLATPLGTELYVSGGVGLALLAGVVLSGLISSSGLLVGGLFAAGSVLLAIMPEVHRNVSGLAPDIRTIEALSSVSVGLPLVITPLLLGMGIAVRIARTASRRTRPSALPGMLLVPLLVAAGWYLAMEAVLGGQRVWMSSPGTTADLEGPASPLVIGLAIGGSALLVLAGMIARWSPAALTVPGILALFATVVFQSLTVVVTVSTLSWSGGQMVALFFWRGGGVPLALVLILGWATLEIVGMRSRRRALRKADADGAPTPSEPSTAAQPLTSSEPPAPSSGTMPLPPRPTSSARESSVAPSEPEASSRET